MLCSSVVRAGAWQGRRGRDTASYLDRAERREARASAAQDTNGDSGDTALANRAVTSVDSGQGILAERPPTIAEALERYSSAYVWNRRVRR